MYIHTAGGVAVSHLSWYTYTVWMNSPGDLLAEVYPLLGQSGRKEWTIITCMGRATMSKWWYTQPVVWQCHICHDIHSVWMNSLGDLLLGPPLFSYPPGGRRRQNFNIRSQPHALQWWRYLNHKNVCNSNRMELHTSLEKQKMIITITCGARAERFKWPFTGAILIGLGMATTLCSL